ncbi:hypothetical protein V1520DRAFT_333749 [Lipomyces starkeyi]
MSVQSGNIHMYYSQLGRSLRRHREFGTFLLFGSFRIYQEIIRVEILLFYLTSAFYLHEMLCWDRILSFVPMVCVYCFVLCILGPVYIVNKRMVHAKYAFQSCLYCKLQDWVPVRL